MQNESAIRQKFKQAAFRHRKRLVEDSLEVCSANCRFSCRPILMDGSPATDMPRICTHPEIMGSVCDDAVGIQATECDLYTPSHSSEEVKESFKTLLNGPRGDLAREYPDLAALSWVLDDVPSLPEEENVFIQSKPNTWDRTRLLLQKIFSVF